MIKKITVFLSVLTLLPLILSNCAKQLHVEYTRDRVQPLGLCLLDKRNHPTKPLIELLTHSTLVNSCDCSTLTLDTIVRTTQQAWNHTPSSLCADECVLDLLNQLCLFKEINPHKNHYTYCFITGNNATTIRENLAYMLELWKIGVRFDNLVFFGNAQSIFSQMILPDGFAQINIQFFDTAIENNDTRVQSSTLGDKFTQWLATDPALGSILLISHQPYVGFHDAIARTFIPSSFEIDTVGACLPTEEQNTAQAFKALAQWVYQENIRRSSK